MPKDKLAGKQIGLAEKRGLARTQEKKTFTAFGRNGRQPRRTARVL